MSEFGEFTVGLLYPRSGPAGLFGPSCLACATLAAEQITARGGLLGRAVAIRPFDAAAGPANVVRQVLRSVDTGEIGAIVGWHTSDVRRALAARLSLRVPYIYTALYEGGESAPGVFMTGETPDAQIRPALRWLLAERSMRRWYIVGSDYLWARASARACIRYVREQGGAVSGISYVPVGGSEFCSVIADIARSDADGVVMLLLGHDAVKFNRAFAAAGLHLRLLRYSPLMDEHMLMASGAGATDEIYASAGYFDAMMTHNSMDFGARYFARFGHNACLPTSMGESCYEGMLLLESLLSMARTAAVRELLRAAHPVRYEGARGGMALRDGHIRQAMYLACADGYDFTVIDQL